MSFIQFDNPRDVQLLAMNNLPLATFERVLSAVKQANENYYQLSETHAMFHNMLCLDDSMITKDPDYRFMQGDDKQEWLKIRNTQSGDRSFINRYLAAELQKEIPSLFADIIEPQITDDQGHNLSGELSMSDDIDALLLSASVPAYFNYLEKMTIYKKGLFSKLRRGYISYLQVRAINVICHFLKAFEADLSLLEKPLLSEPQLENWPKMGEIIAEICDRADPHHHDQISLYAVNCLRSLYISVFNIAVFLHLSNREVPREIRQFLPLVPDRISFNKKQLQEDEAWERYQEHLFLFLRAPEEIRGNLEACLSKLLPAQKVVWIGCLGKGEIRNLVLPILARGDHFEKLAIDCQKIPASDGENSPFGKRVMDVLSDIYVGHLRTKKTVSKKTHLLFAQAVKARKSGSGRLDGEEQIDLNELRSLSFLVVDDSDRIRQMTIDVLKKTGIKRVASASNGAEAWSILQKKKMDVVLCDWIMPELTGIQLAQKIMQVDKLASKLTFVMLTTVNSKVSIVEALSAGVRGYLIKPFTRKQLLEKVYFATEWLRKEQAVKNIDR